ncbi:molybdopterin-dependent oxidoreductase [Qipengyuania qiaonensis]|uniref:Molybdopterin-dependent oxidoreductase n=1 Tax=Qipengyuania qiaonensis TaxID=2867240 RepID=A0ABS7J0M9_9SPHN|nr:molybdopterin-dependent oxidoreductase [Qipengyuania qiaonensis]MBX7480907.1 molybdopterin-dependent oxidoreductase [Qipengyuania qiaonensis]
MKRRNFLVAAGAAFVAGCNRIAETDAGKAVLNAAESWHKSAHRLLVDREALAPEYPKSAISPFFRGNGSTDPQNGDYPRHVEEGFANWRLEVGGLVANPLSLSLENIRRLPQRTQITRHDCVEGWSAIGEWTGPQLSVLLDAARLSEDARFIVFRCADNLSGADYYESVDLIDAYHPQTIVAHTLNGEPLPIRNGAPLRMRIERQLGYKHAKYLTAVEAVASLDGIGDGQGGYWEDRAGYQWYAGI